MRILHIYISALIVVAAALLFIPFLGAVHLFDWDEINFAESAREMLITGNYARVQINFQPFWEKPPLFIWLQALSMNIFGINEFSARLPNAIFGIITLSTFFYIGRKFFNIRFGAYWALAYAGSFLPHLYFKSGIIDPVFNYFIFLSIFFLVILTSLSINFYYQRLQTAFLSGLFIGLAILTKGPAALLIILLTILVYMIVVRTWRLFSIRETLIFFATAFVISSFWFAYETIKNGPWFLVEFVVYQIRLFQTEDAGHGQPFFYHFVVLLIGVFPASAFIFKSFRKYYSDNLLQHNFRIWMVISLFVVLILFSIAKTKIVHYSSFCYFPISFLAAYILDKTRFNKVYYGKAVPLLILIIGVIISLALTLFPLAMKVLPSLIEEYGHLIKDPFALANMQAEVEWSGWEALVGIFYFAIVLSVFKLFYKNPLRYSLILFISTIFVIQACLILLVPKIERYSQGAKIDFMKSVANEDAYVEVYGYKSYAHLFYGKKQPDHVPQTNDMNWLLNEPIDRPLYMVTKIHRKEELEKNPQFRELYNKNGFVFYKKERTP